MSEFSCNSDYYVKQQPDDVVTPGVPPSADFCLLRDEPGGGVHLCRHDPGQVQVLRQLHLRHTGWGGDPLPPPQGRGGCNFTKNLICFTTGIFVRIL